MSAEPPRPIFGFLWPAPDPRVDDAAVQERLVRIPARGPARLAVLVLASLALVTATGSTLLAALGSSAPAIAMVAAVLATAWLLVVRAWAVGTFVNDSGVVVVQMLSTRSAAWARVEAVGEVRDRVEVHLVDGSVMRTSVRRRSLDLVGRPEAYDIARLALQRWFEQG